MLVQEIVTGGSVLVQDIGDRCLDTGRHLSQTWRTPRRARCSAMSKARLVITALLVDHRSPAEVAARDEICRARVYWGKGGQSSQDELSER